MEGPRFWLHRYRCGYSFKDFALQTASAQSEKYLTQCPTLWKNSTAVLLFFHQFVHKCVQIIIHSTISRLPAVYVVLPLLYVSTSEKPHTTVYYQHLVLDATPILRLPEGRRWRPFPLRSPHRQVSATPCTCVSLPEHHHPQF